MGRRSGAGGFRSAVVLAVCLAICHAAGVPGAFFVPGGAGGWYDGLVKPVWTPPSVVFAGVWLILYTLMGVSLFLVVRRRSSRQRSVALLAFGAQWLVNASFSPVFFGLHSVWGGFFCVLLLVPLVLMCIVFFARVSLCAAWLLVPYALWSLFALALMVQVLHGNL